MLVGYSGGADSTCLLHLLHRLGHDVTAAYLHHGQRVEADAEVKQCAKFCDEIGVPFLSGKADVPLMARELKIGLEEAGRNARYEFFRRAAVAAEAPLIATAHTRTDLIETVLLNIARGCGLAGLTGIPARRDNIVRPLLPFEREETKAYCAENGFWTHDDPANSDLSFARARVRHRIVGDFQSINPRFVDAVARLAKTADEEDRFLNGVAAAALENAEIPLNGDLAFLTHDIEVAFRRTAMTALPAVVFKRGLRLAVGAVGGALEFEHCERLMWDVPARDKGALTCEGGQVVVEWDANEVHIRQVQPSLPYRFNLTLPGETASDEFHWQFTAYMTVPGPQERASLDAYLEPSAIKGTLYFRSFQEGDTVQPLGFHGRRKMSDVLGERHLTHAARARLPILCDLSGPLWAPGVCLSERMRLQPETQEAIFVRFGEIRRDNG